MTEEARGEFLKLHISLVRMGAVSQVDRAYVERYGLPHVVLPFFMRLSKYKKD